MLWTTDLTFDFYTNSNSLSITCDGSTGKQIASCFCKSSLLYFGVSDLVLLLDRRKPSRWLLSWSPAPVQNLVRRRFPHRWTLWSEVAVGEELSVQRCTVRKTLPLMFGRLVVTTPHNFIIILNTCTNSCFISWNMKYVFLLLYSDHQQFFFSPKLLAFFWLVEMLSSSVYSATFDF